MAKSSSDALDAVQLAALKAGCKFCGERVLRKYAHDVRTDVRSGTVEAWHSACAPRARLVVA